MRDGTPTLFAIRLSMLRRTLPRAQPDLDWLSGLTALICCMGSDFYYCKVRIARDHMDLPSPYLIG